MYIMEYIANRTIIQRIRGFQSQEEEDEYDTNESIDAGVFIWMLEEEMIDFMDLGYRTYIEHRWMMVEIEEQNILDDELRELQENERIIFYTTYNFDNR